MGKPTTDRGAMQQIIRALIADGWALSHVNDTGENVPVRNETEAIAAIEATGIGHLYVKRPAGADLPVKRGSVFFVLGNDPEEVAADWTLNLTVVETVTDGWWSE